MSGVQVNFVEKRIVLDVVFPLPQVFKKDDEVIDELRRAHHEWRFAAYDALSEWVNDDCPALEWTESPMGYEFVVVVKEGELIEACIDRVRKWAEGWTYENVLECKPLDLFQDAKEALAVASINAASIESIDADTGFPTEEEMF